jgi:histidine triad (HIT) family protein
MPSLFTKIIKKEIPAEIVFENENIIAIKDIYPKAPVHLLIMPKKEYAKLQDVPKEDLPVIAEIVQVAQELAKEFDIQDNYRFLTNNGEEAGQSIFHLHFHLIGGKVLGTMA